MNINPNESTTLKRIEGIPNQKNIYGVWSSEIICSVFFAGENKRVITNRHSYELKIFDVNKSAQKTNDNKSYISVQNFITVEQKNPRIC